MVPELRQWWKAKSPDENLHRACFLSGVEQTFSSTDKAIHILWAWTYSVGWDGSIIEMLQWKLDYKRSDFVVSSYEEYLEWRKEVEQ